MKTNLRWPLIALSLLLWTLLQACATTSSGDARVLEHDYAGAQALYERENSAHAKLQRALLAALSDAGHDDSELSKSLLAQLVESDVAAVAQLVGELMAKAQAARHNAATCTALLSDMQAKKRRELTTCQEALQRAVGELSGVQAELAKAKSELEAMKRIDLRRR